MRSYVLEAGNEFSWVDALPFVKFSINSTKIDITIAFLFELVYGSLLVSSVDWVEEIS